MTRRGFFWMLSAAAAQSAVTVPIRIVIDTRPKLRPEQLALFWSHIWTQCVQTFAAGGIRLAYTTGEGKVGRSPADRPIFTGLDRAAANVVVTDEIPLLWDNGRGLAGVSTRYDGYDLSLIALNNAHGHQVPFFSVNTSVHELLHVLLLDIFGKHPGGVAGQEREFRIDWYATRLWLFHDGSFVRDSARRYVERLRWEASR